MKFKNRDLQPDIGEGGLDLQDKYREGMRTVFGIHSKGYPNLFVMGGYQASFQFNLTYMLQTQGDHIAECIAYVRENGFDTIDPTEETEEWWVQEVIENRGKPLETRSALQGITILRVKVRDARMAITMAEYESIGPTWKKHENA